MTHPAAADDPATQASSHVLAHVAAELTARWPEGTGGLDAVHRYALSPPGKLLRPLLLCHSALMLDARLEHVLPAALGIECAHVGSLVHDDILDGDCTRRARPAVHLAYGRDRAIIAGNALFFQWFTALAQCAHTGVSDRQICQAMAVQAQAGVETCQGADEELSQAGRLDIPVSAYLATARRKTAVMFAAACRIGAILADAGPEQQHLLAAYGEHVGLAFQIRDDLLPYGAGANSSGKPADSDLRNQRPTLPVLLALQHGDEQTRRDIHRILTPPVAPDAHRVLHGLLRSCGAVDQAARIAREHTTAARRALADLPPGPHRVALDRLADHAQPAGVSSPAGRKTANSRENRPR
jgi:geranylgeranyl diphosphate synthase type I